MPKINGKKIPYPEAEKTKKFLGGTVGATRSAAKRASSERLPPWQDRGDSTRGVYGNKEEEEKWMEEMEKRQRRSPYGEPLDPGRKNMGGSIARGSGAARPQLFRKNG